MKFNQRGRRCSLTPRVLQQVFAIIFVCLMTACGGQSATDNSTDNTGQGAVPSVEKTELYVSLTDAEGDFLSYTVDVKSIVLTHASGSVVELLPAQTRVDFAQYVEVSELLSLTNVPVGRYESAELILDFSDAEIIVQDDEGNPITANVVDDNGSALGETVIEIALMNRDGFVLRPRVAAHITLDFDLESSNEITIDGDSATVRVQPVLLADTGFDDGKPLRMRGRLVSVNEVDSNFVMDIRPFRHRARNFGEFRVFVSENTEFDIDDELISSDQGLSVLADLSTLSPVVVAGNWDREQARFYANEVRAGTSVEWTQADFVRGTVIARDGNVISLKGAIAQHSDGRVRFREQFDLTLSDETQVLKRGEADAGIEDISVGSAIVARGLIDDETLDLSEGIVRIYQSSIAGTVISADPLVLDLTMINGRRVQVYDFAGTGMSEAEDADEAMYEIRSGDLALGSVLAGDPVRIKGFVSDFGTAPADFVANSIVDHSSVRAHLRLRYDLKAGEEAIVEAGEQGIAFDLSLAGRLKHVIRAGIPVDLSELESPLLLAPSAENGMFSISHGRRIEVYSHYSDFTAALEQDLSDGSILKRCDAHGAYDSLAATFSSHRIRVRFESSQD